MEQVKVDVPRQAPPAWAAQGQLPGKRMASQKQLDYILSLIRQKDLSVLSAERQQKLKEIESVPATWDSLTTTMSFTRAGEILDMLIPLKYLPRNEQDSEAVGAAHVVLVQLPAGRYAVENDQGELRFYKKWVSQDGKLHRIYVQHGYSESGIPLPGQIGVAKKILAAGVRECAIRYGMEIGACSNCGRRLTNRISRALGIGPVCGGRMFGDDWSDEVADARQRLVDQGIDPDEEVDD